jgi:hypothetical protein
METKKPQEHDKAISENSSPAKEHTPLHTTKTNHDKGKWEIIEILARPISATLTAVAIAVLGYWGQKTITNISAQNQTRLTTISAQEQDARLYTELLSRREQSESLLRKDMFSLILADFFEKSGSAGSSSDVSLKLLKLELLALNFGDSLSLGPLFNELRRDIEKAKPSEKEKLTWNMKKKEYEKRLHSLAKRVASAQLAAIKLRGISQVIEIPVDKVLFTKDGIGKSYLWPDDQYNQLDNLEKETLKQLVADQKRLTLEGVTWVFSLQFTNARFMQKTVDIELNVYKQNPDGQLTQNAPYKTFKLDYFNFPLIDNTRLPNNQRFSLVMTDFNEEIIRVEGILFPGVYSSQRDKPYLNEILEELREPTKAKEKS